jgi:O-antigen ligase
MSIGIWIALNLKWVLQLVGTDTTLNNRMMLWATLAEKAKHHLWIGYGYQAFWQGGKIGTSGEVAKAIGWYPSHAHNGFLDLLLDLGLAGLSAFLILVAIVFFRAYQIALTSSPQRRLDLWPLIYLIFFVGYNLAESDLFLPNHLMWFLFVAVTTNLLIRQKKTVS